MNKKTTIPLKKVRHKNISLPSRPLRKAVNYLRNCQRGLPLLAAVSAALLLGGAVLLTKDDVLQRSAEKRTEDVNPITVVQKQLDDISDRLNTETADNSEIPDTSAAEETEIVQTDMLPDETTQSLMDSTKSLHGEYPDVIGWLYLPHTAINYPVMQGSDNDHYLNYSFDGRNLQSGSVFLDYRCEGRFMNPINIIYAHNMRNGSMFAGLEKFKVSDFFESHKYGWLATPEAVYQLDFFAADVVDCNDILYDGSMPAAEWLPHIEEKAVVCIEIEHSDDDRFISLSTCSNEFKDARTVLVGKLKKMNGG